MSFGYAAGALGGLLYVLAIYASYRYGILQHFHVSLYPGMSLEWLYPRVILGGVLGWLFVTPLFQIRSVVERALILSLVPTLFMLFYYYPFLRHEGFFGFELGTLTPAFVFVYSLVWSLGTALWLKWVGS